MMKGIFILKDSRMVAGNAANTRCIQMHRTPLLVHRGLRTTLCNPQHSETPCSIDSLPVSSLHTKGPLGRASSQNASRLTFTCQAAAANHTDLADLSGIPDISDEQLLSTPLDKLMSAARALRDAAHTCITFSPKVFIPLTRLCRDSCGYCTFALPPSPGRRVYMTIDEVLQIARLGQQQGCTEALFTLGDKPEMKWPEAAAELKDMGFNSTLEYVEEAARKVLQQTGLIPHINAGVMDLEWLARLKKVSASQGLMLESTSEALLAPGGAHYDCPDKEPAQRLQVLRDAGEQAVPFTTGILVGIGETREDRLAALRAIKVAHDRYGHIQEIIIQNFRAKKGTLMHLWPEPPVSELLWTVAAARLIMGPHISIQAPPNLTPEPDDATAHSTSPDAVNTSAAAAAGSADVLQHYHGREGSWRALLDAGINDWSGISPVTKDHVNPEAPWPHIQQLAAVTAAAGYHLLPRLPVYPQYIGLRGGPRQWNEQHTNQQHHSESQWLSDDGGAASSVRAAVIRMSDSSGLTRGSTWYAGTTQQQEETQQQQEQYSTQDGENESGTAHATGHTSNSHSTKSSHEQQIRVSVTSSASQQHTTTSSTPTSIEPSYSSTTTANQSTSQPQQQQQQQLQPSVPSVRVRKDRAWAVARDSSGALQGCDRPSAVSPKIQRLLDKVLQAASGSGSSIQWTHDDVAALLHARGTDHAAILSAADTLRALSCGDTVTYVVNRNINYTNVCTLKCGFCAFSKGKASEALRGPAYLVPLQEISRRAAEAWDRGATEVCMQGGIHPDFTGHDYVNILRAAKEGAPGIHVHAFSPLEVQQGAASLDMAVHDYLAMLKDNGLGSLPGTAAEVLCDDVRSVLCPDKIDSQTWLQVVKAAHEVGLRTTSTLMFGHVEHGPHAWARHLLSLRELQQQTGGITEFVPLPFVHMESPIYIKGQSRRGPTLSECFLLHAVSRLVLYPVITNIQASWVKMGPHMAGDLLSAGCNDMGGVLMNESITRAAGASHGQQLPATEMERIITAAGRTPQQRTTLYGRPSPDQTHKSLSTESLRPLQPLAFSKP